MKIILTFKGKHILSTMQQFMSFYKTGKELDKVNLALEDWESEINNFCQSKHKE